MATRRDRGADTPGLSMLPLKIGRCERESPENPRLSHDQGAKNGVSRFEYEYEIPVEDAAEMLDRLCERPLIEKLCHSVSVNGREWVIDVFEGDNAGLVVAEIELADETQAIELPVWVGEEESDDPRYLNVNLAKHPYRL